MTTIPVKLMIMELVVANLSGRTRTETLNGRQHLVLPIVLIVEGVLNGSAGALFYPWEEFSKDPTVWNNMPLVLNHPTTQNGHNTSARMPSILTEFGMGAVYNSSCNPTKRSLGAEAWLDVENTQRISQKTWDNLKAGKPVNISTGLITQNVRAPAGSKDRLGRPYEWIARNYRPDHVAILPDHRGACDLTDGCGLNVHNIAGITNGGPNIVQRFISMLMGSSSPVANQLSHLDVRSALSQALQEKYPPQSAGDMSGMGGMMSMDYGACVMDVFDKYVVYEYQDKTYRLDYTIDNRSDTVTLSSDSPVEVRRVTTYKPVSNLSGLGLETSIDDQGEDYMAVKLNDVQRKQIVDSLVTNCSCPQTMPWKGKDAATLNALSDDVLLAYEDVRKAVSGQQTTQTTVANRDSHIDPFGNRHVWNQQTNQWDTYPAQQVLVAQPVVPGQQTVATQNAGNTHVTPTNPEQTATLMTTPVTGSKQTAEEWYKNAPPEIQQAVRNAFELTQQEKANLIGKLVANAGTDEAKTQLGQIYGAMDLPQLRVLAAALPQPQQNTSVGNLFSSFAGAAGIPPTTTNQTTEEPMTSPVYNYAGNN